MHVRIVFHTTDDVTMHTLQELYCVDFISVVIP